MTQARSHSLKKENRLIAKTLLLCGLIALASVLGIYSPKGHASPELGFTDKTPSGLQILPASGSGTPCSTALPASPTNPNAYALYGGVAQVNINSQTMYFCIDNASIYQYFVPSKSYNELNSFYNAAQGALTGVTASPL